MEDGIIKRGNKKTHNQQNFPVTFTMKRKNKKGYIFKNLRLSKSDISLISLKKDTMSSK